MSLSKKPFSVNQHTYPTERCTLKILSTTVSLMNANLEDGGFDIEEITPKEQVQGLLAQPATGAKGLATSVDKRVQLLIEAEIDGSCLAKIMKNKIAAALEEMRVLVLRRANWAA